MHELSLCMAIARTATDHANGRPVDRVFVRIGHFRQVVPDTLQFNCMKLWCLKEDPLDEGQT